MAEASLVQYVSALLARSFSILHPRLAQFVCFLSSASECICGKRSAARRLSSPKIDCAVTRLDAHADKYRAHPHRQTSPAAETGKRILIWRSLQDVNRENR